MQGWHKQKLTHPSQSCMIWQYPAQLLVGAAEELLHCNPRCFRWQSP